MTKKKIKMSFLLAAALLAGITTEVPAAPKETLVFVQELEGEAYKEVYRQLLSEYTKKTGVKIQWETYSHEEYRNYIQTSFSRGTAPDVYTGSLSEMTEDFKKGWLHNFLYLYDEENSYDPGKPWGEALPVQIKDKMYISNKEIPGYPASSKVVKILCNKELFDSAHVEIPETWAEFLESCQKLSDSGVMPFAFPGSSWEEPAWQWLVNSLGNQTAGILSDNLDVNEKNKGYVELNEFCKGVDEGEVDYKKMAAPYVRLKEAAPFLLKDTGGLTQEMALEAFAEGKAAMVMAESSSLGEIYSLSGEALSVEAISVPVITKETDENAMEKSVLCGGEPERIYGIRASLKKEEEKFEAAVDFVQYMTSCEVQERLAEDTGLLPSDKAASLPKDLEGFQISEEAGEIPFFSGVSEPHTQKLWEILKEYISGNINEAELEAELKSSCENAVSEIKDLKGWNITNNYGMPTASECTMCEP